MADDAQRLLDGRLGEVVANVRNVICFVRGAAEMHAQHRGLAAQLATLML